jgi:NADH-quinone oxidoreductase subunit I
MKRPAMPGRGLVKGMAVTFKTMIRTIFLPKKYLATVNYPVEKETPVPRARGVIALDQEACTVCMLCARNCPDWCIYIEGHKEEKQPRRQGQGSGDPRSV